MKRLSSTLLRLTVVASSALMLAACGNNNSDKDTSSASDKSVSVAKAKSTAKTKASSSAKAKAASESHAKAVAASQAASAAASSQAAASSAAASSAAAASAAAASSQAAAKAAVKPFITGMSVYETLSAANIGYNDDGDILTEGARPDGSYLLVKSTADNQLNIFTMYPLPNNMCKITRAHGSGNDYSKYPIVQSTVIKRYDGDVHTGD